MNNPLLPLDDLRVLDLTHYYNGPYATMLLAYLGAEVIKIESPDLGDGARPLYRAAGKPFGIPFALMNSNKRAITLNLKSDEGAATLQTDGREGRCGSRKFRRRHDGQVGTELFSIARSESATDIRIGDRL